MSFVNGRDKKRITVILLLCLVAFSVLIGRIFYLQIIKGSYYKQKAYLQQTKDRLVDPTRGTIYDSTGQKKLAVSVDTKYLYATPTKIDDNDKEKLAADIADITKRKENEILKKLNQKVNKVTLATKLNDETVKNIKKYIDENKIKGLVVGSTVSRIYPYKNLLSHLLGFTGIDSQGLSGIENSYDEYLKGTPGKIVGTIDVVGNETPYKDEKYIEPINGYDLTLTIDSKIQAIVEKHLSKAVKENTADGGVCIIMKPSTGEILAMASYPDYDPNEPFQIKNEKTKAKWDKLSKTIKTKELNAMWRNTAISDTFEPGSTFKVVTAASGLEENIIEMDKPNVFRCDGYVIVNGWKIKCWKYPAGIHGGESLRQGIMNSCNPFFMQLGAKIGIERYVKYLKGFNLYAATGIDLPGEATGIMHEPKNMTALDLATNSFGQGIQITALQTAVMYSAIANGGNIMTPYVVKQIKSSNGNVISQSEPVIKKQVISKETSDILMSALYDTVESGTGMAARINGYSLAGKTGTGEQSRGKSLWYMSSFVGIAPVNDPEIVIVFNIYNPLGTQGRQGGKVCATVVGNIADETLRYLDFNPSYTVEESVVKEIVATNVVSKTYAEAKKIIEKEGFKIAFDSEFEPKDIVLEQIPKAGASLTRGATIRVYKSITSKKATTKVPDVRGKNLKNSIAAIRNAGLNIRIIGVGKAIYQDPGPKDIVVKGSIITVKFVDTTNIH